MPRLIDADALEKQVEERVKYLVETNGYYDHYTTGFEDACDYIEKAPTIEAEPVRHGKWKFDAITSQDYVSGEYDEIFYLECPFCGRREYDLDLYACLGDDFHKVIADYPYCHCGAKMDLDVMMDE